MERNKLLQNVTKCRCLIHEMSRNAEAETTECYEMTHEQTWAPTFCNILLRSGY